MDSESIISVFALFDCFGAILNELLIAGLMELVYQSDAYRVSQGLGKQGKNDIYFSGTEEERSNFEGNKDILRNGERTKILRKQRNKPILFQRKQGNRYPPPP